MACHKRQTTGSCSHDQCPFPTETEHGYECVEIQDGYCEVGLDCLSTCQFSWPEEKKHIVRETFERAFGF